MFISFTAAVLAASLFDGALSHGESPKVYLRYAGLDPCPVSCELAHL